MRYFSYSVVACMFLLAIAPVSAQNLLSNPGFESGLTGWTNDSGWGINGTYAQPTGPVSGSNYASYSNCCDGTAREIRQAVAVTPGQTYLLSVWVWSDTSPDVVRSLLQYRDGADPGLGNSQTLDAFYTSTSGWQQLSGYVTPTGSTLTFTFRGELDGANWGVHIDDASVTAVTPSGTFPATSRQILENFDSAGWHSDSYTAGWGSGATYNYRPQADAAATISDGNCMRMERQLSNAGGHSIRSSVYSVPNKPATVFVQTLVPPVAIGNSWWLEVWVSDGAKPASWYDTNYDPQTDVLIKKYDQSSDPDSGGLWEEWSAEITPTAGQLTLAVKTGGNLGKYVHFVDQVSVSYETSASAEGWMIYE